MFIIRLYEFFNRILRNALLVKLEFKIEESKLYLFSFFFLKVSDKKIKVAWVFPHRHYVSSQMHSESS